MSRVLFRLFQTPGDRYYAYDRQTNDLISVQKDEYEELKSVMNGEIEEEDSRVLQHFREMGIFGENTIRKIIHPDTEYIGYLSDNRLNQLILQVTQNCNLRCRYCPYSGLLYPNQRKHNRKRMDFETAKRAIDFHLSRILDTNSVTVSFYGGEPLLEFELIRQCIEYAESSVEGHELSFNMTTNGTLLRGRIAEYLAEHHVHLTISLDGSKEEHDVNRRFENGSGSFDVIMRNVKELTERYPEYTKKYVSFSTTINPKLDIGCVLEFFTTDQVMKDKMIFYNQINAVELSDTWTFTERADCLRRYEYMKLLFMLAGKLDRKYVSDLVIQSEVQYRKMKRALQENSVIGERCHPGGPCVPGVKRLFVTTDGVFYPCEKVSETNPYYSIGSLDTGFDYDRIRSMLNNAESISEKCKGCWNILNCRICSGMLAFGDRTSIDAEIRSAPCEDERNRTLMELYEQAVLHEFGYDGEEFSV